MKKIGIKSMLAATVLFSLLTTSCGSSAESSQKKLSSQEDLTKNEVNAVFDDIEKLLPGTWTTVKTMSEEETDEDFASDVSMETYETYNADHSMTLKGEIEMVYHAYNEYGSNPINISLRFSGQGAWSVKGDILSEHCTSVDVKLEKVDALYADDFYHAIKQNAGMLAKQFKEALMEGGDLRIKEISENRMVQEDDGVTLYYSRVSE